MRPMSRPTRGLFLVQGYIYTSTTPVAWMQMAMLMPLLQSSPKEFS